MVLFVAFVAFEVVRAIKYAQIHEHARLLEAERLERETTAAVHQRRMTIRANLKLQQQMMELEAMTTEAATAGSESS